MPASMKRAYAAATLALTAATLVQASEPAAGLGEGRDASVRAILAPPSSFDRPERFEAFPGGAATSKGANDADAFSRPSGNLSFEERSRFFVGNGVFKKLWVPAPASTQASDGLGPLFNTRSCQGCHLKDGRGHPPPEGVAGDAASFVLGLSVPATAGDVEAPQTPSELVAPEPTYGAQLHDFAATGLAPEGQPVVTYRDVPVELAGGEVVTLREPSYEIANLGYGPLHPATMISPRVAPQMIGMGLLEAVPDADLLALADPDDEDGDGISGRLNRHPDLALEGNTGDAIGRFGWKAIQPTVRQQSAFAFATDMGLSSPVVPVPQGDCTEAQAACVAGPHGTSNDEHEVPAELLDLVVFYAENLAVPPRRGEAEPEVLRGKGMFHAAGCAACHQPKFVTSEDERVPEHLRRQLIWPYTDLLLHDMGEGLADHRPQGLASGFEWRTAPLWGIGLTDTVNGHQQLLHDGRARGVKEAILWHGGEGQAARDAFAAMPKQDREALIAFVNSL